jgi:DNA-binding SARP family transcriptional activator
MSGMERLDIAMLGRFAVSVEGTALDPAAFEHRRGADLVKVLALAPGHRLARDRVVELLWPKLPADAGQANLHKAAHYARRALGDRRAVVLAQGFVELAPDAGVRTDVERFEGGDDDAYRGPLLPEDPYEEWAVPARERLRDLRVERLRHGGRWHDVLAADPADEQAHRELMREHLRAGDRLAAARRFRLLRDELALLGLQPAAETLELASELSGGPAVHASLVSEGPVVGRKAELAVAAEALQRARAGRGTTLVVTGDAGMGKSRYVEAILGAAQRRGWHTLRGAAHGDEASVPYRPVLEALDPLLLERPDLLAGLSAGSRSTLGRLSPAAAADAGAPDAPVELHAALAAVAHLVRAAARERGLVLALEDLHAADEATLQVVDYLATAVRAEPAIILLSARPTGAAHPVSRLGATLLQHGTGSEIVLERLAAGDIRELALRAASHPLADAALDAIERTADGNPFYAQELAAAADVTGGVRVPDHVHKALDARLERLSGPAAGLLPALAVADNGFSPAELAAIAGLPEADVATILEDASCEGVLRQRPDGWSFRHPLLRAAAARRVAPPHLALAHTRAAERLTAGGAAPERIAHHLLAGGEYAAAVPLLAQAARRAAALGAYADGRRWLEEALQHAAPAERGALHALLADLRYATGDRAAVAAYATAVRAAPAGEVADLRIKQTMAAIAAGDLDAAEEALAGLSASDDEQGARMRIARGLVAWYRGDIDHAARCADEAQAIVDATGGALPLLADLRAMVAHARGRWESHAEWELGQVWHTPQLAGQVFDAYLCVTEYVLHSGDQYGPLIAFAEDLHRQAAETGARRGQAFSATVLGEAHLLSGGVETARHYLLEATRLSREVGAVGGESLARARLGEALAALGDRVGARAHLEEALELAHASVLAPHLLFLVHTPLLRLEADTDAALARVDGSEILLEDQGHCMFCPVTYALAAASVCVRAGQLDRAEGFLARARESASVWPPGTWSPAVCEVRGELARAHGAEEEAATFLRRAVDGYAATGQRLYEARAAATLAGTGLDPAPSA